MGEEEIPVYAYYIFLQGCHEREQRPAEFCNPEFETASEETQSQTTAYHNELM